jgi:hypothetical protein
MNELYVLSNTLLLILAFFYFCQIRTEQKSKTKIHDLFLNYKPERMIKDQDIINERFLLYVYPRIKFLENPDVSKRGFKNLEFCFAEILLNILSDYNQFQNEKNDFMTLRLKIKFNKFIEYYGKCFYEDDKDIYLMSLGQRLIRNMCSCDIDMFNLYHLIYKILNRNSINNSYLLQGLENYLHKNELIFIEHSDIKINKNEIFNLYKYCFKNISNH